MSYTIIHLFAPFGTPYKTSTAQHFNCSTSMTKLFVCMIVSILTQKQNHKLIQLLIMWTSMYPKFEKQNPMYSIQRKLNK